MSAFAATALVLSLAAAQPAAAFARELGLPVVAASATIEQITGCITRDCPAVFVNLGDSRFDILTKYDLLRAIAHSTEES